MKRPKESWKSGEKLAEFMPTWQEVLTKPPEEAYKRVQKNAMQSWTNGKDFLTLLKKDKDIRKLLSAGEIEQTFKLKTQFKNIDRIFKRVFKSTS